MPLTRPSLWHQPGSARCSHRCRFQAVA